MTLSDTTAVASPLVDVRDVLETFRRHGILMENWDVILSNAATALDQQVSADEFFSSVVTYLAAQLRTLVTNGMQANIDIVNSIADEAQRILSQIRIRGIPRPEDEHWEFA